jgi:putative phosphoserine phosphatase / 1-acylglycerol-3-phosphate O-acyltransferase
MQENQVIPSEQEQILNDTAFQKTLNRIAVQKGESLEQVRQEAAGYIEELYTKHHPMANMAFMEAVQYIVSRGYDRNIDVNPAEIKQLTKVMRKHPIAFVMTHKSYIDTLVLSLVLVRHGLPIPFTFAGKNLDFFGAGQLARQNGVIFIRRSFKDNPVYKATLRHFTAWLLDRQSHFMWAIEGTRSRTGKLVWPQMGILKYIVEAEQEARHSVRYVPVSIVYDLIPDVTEMTKEGRGKDKKPESFTWMLNYIRKMDGNLGRIALRLGEAVALTDAHKAPIPDEDEGKPDVSNPISLFAFELVRRINQITPVTTTSLICTALLSKFALTKRGIESDISDLMRLIESHKKDALVDRGRPIGESVQRGLELLTKAHIFLQQGDGLNAKYTIMRENYLSATYYANMGVHHLFHRAFIEMALVKIQGLPAKERPLAFWTEIMALRDIFKFEFFYSKKPEFSDEIEADLKFIDPKWQDNIFRKKSDVHALMERQKLLVAPVLLYNYIEAYRVVAQGLLTWDQEQHLEEGKFITFCLFLGEEMHWQGRIRRIEAVSKPFLQNGIRLMAHLKLLPKDDLTAIDRKAVQAFIAQLDDMADRINILQGITLAHPEEALPSVPVERDIVPGSVTESITAEIMAGESGPHIGAFFDLDRTLIKGFSAKDFFKARVLSGKMAPKEIVAQFAGALSYATGNGNFASMAAIGARGVKGVKEQVFIDVGEEVYHKYLAEAIYPESRALVSAHLAKGHTVAIISAATPYQVNPIARDLGINKVMCTRMEVKKGEFTGNIIEPACWGEGKAIAARQLSREHGLDMAKSYFYTDSVEDLPLLEIVGHPRPLNPDAKLSVLAFQNDWPVSRFQEEDPSQVTNLVRTGLAAGTFVPAILTGVAKGLTNMSWQEGIESMMAGLGDFGTAAAGINLAVRGEEHLWSQRPAVFILNHQSNADFLIAAKLIRKGARGVAKKELQKMPIVGQMLMASGTIFLDRTDKEKSIEALKPAVESLKTGTSVVIFPEGTRSYDYTLGPFKKGAFHLAMQAGVPLVPIVLKNAHDAMPRGSNIFRPVTVEVVVLPPVSTAHWTKENMETHIAEVRQLFLQELGQK